MQKTFLRNLVLVIALNLLIKPIYIFGIDRTVQNEVGAAEYGYYFALLNFVYLFQIFNDLGLQNFSHTLFSKHAHLINKYLPRVLGLKIWTAFLFIVATLGAGWLVGYPLRSNTILFLLILNQLLASLLVIMRTSFSAAGYYAMDSILSAFDKFLMIAFVGAMFWIITVVPFEITHFILAQTVSFTVSIVLAAALMLHKGLLKSYRIAFDISYSKWVLLRSAPFALILLLMTLYTRMDSVMLERMLPDGDEQAGIYAASYRILDAFNMIGLLFAGLLLPMFSKSLNNMNALSKLVETSFGVLTTISICASIFCWFYAEDLISLLYVEATKEWSEVFRYLMMTFIAVSWAYIFGTLLTASASMKTMNLIFLLGLGLNLLLNLILIPHYKSLGATWATLATQYFVSISLIYVCNSKFKLPIDSRLFMKITWYTLTLILAGLTLRYFQIGYLFAVIILGIIAIIISLGFKLVSGTQLGNLFQKSVVLD